MRGVDRRIRGRQIGRIGHGARLQRHHRPGSEREPATGRVQQPGAVVGGGVVGRGSPGNPEPDHVLRVAVGAVRGRPHVDRPPGGQQVHDNVVRVHDGQARGPSPAQLHGAVDHGRRTASGEVVPGVRQYRYQVPQGRRGDHGVHVRGRR